MTTLADLINSVRLRTDTVKNIGFLPDAELIGYVNESLGELDDVLVGLSEDYKLTSSLATVTAPADSFELPDDFLKARGLDRQTGGQWATVYPYQLQERNRWAVPWSGVQVEPVAYRIQGTTCKLTPEQNANGSYRLWYVPRFAPLVALDDALPWYMDSQSWSQYAIADVGAKVTMKQDMDASQWLSTKAELRQRILTAASNRDAGPPKKIVNTRRARRGGLFR